MMGFLDALTWLFFGQLYHVKMRVGDSFIHEMYVKAHDITGARMKALKQAERRFTGLSLMVHSVN